LIRDPGAECLCHRVVPLQDQSLGTELPVGALFTPSEHRERIEDGGYFVDPEREDVARRNGVDLRHCGGIADLGDPGREVRVVRNQLAMNPEDVHALGVLLSDL